MKLPFGQILYGAIRVGKTLTSLSVLIGVLAGIDVNVIWSFAIQANEKGLGAALDSFNGIVILPLTFLVVGFWGLFVMVELKQSKATAIALAKLDELEKLDDVVVELKKISSMMASRQKQEEIDKEWEEV